MEKIKDLGKKYPGKKVLIQLNLWDKKHCQVLEVAKEKPEAEAKTPKK